MQLGHVIGVDQEGGVLRIVEARRRFLRQRVLNACRLRLPEDPGEARLVLERFARAHGFRRVPCVFGMSTETTLLRLFALPPARRRNLAQQVREKLEQFSTLPMEGALEAHTLLRSAGAGLRMLLGLTRRDALDRQLELPGAAGLNVVAAVPVPLAAFRAAASLWPRRKGAFLGLHLRRDKTLLAAGHGTDLLQLWTVPFGTDHLLPAEMPQDGERELRNRWIQEVQACLEAFAREPPADRPPIRTLLLNGAEPLTPDCITALARATERRVLRLEKRATAPVPARSGPLRRRLRARACGHGATTRHAQPDSALPEGTSRPALAVQVLARMRGAPAPRPRSRPRAPCGAASTRNNPRLRGGAPADRGLPRTRRNLRETTERNPHAAPASFTLCCAPSARAPSCARSWPRLPRPSMPTTGSR